MGHVAHYKAGAVGQLVAHIERTRDNPAQYGNEKIDPEKTHLNFSPEKCEGFPVFKFWEQVAEKQGQQRKSSDNALTGVIFTLPQRYLNQSKEWQDQFFRNTYDFLKKKFGVEKDGHSNIYCASVHYDETTPHLHFAFVPVVRNDFERHYKDRHGEIRTATVKAGSISSRYVVTKSVLSSLHQELDRYLERTQKGYNGGILLDEEEKIDRHLMMPAKELKQMPEDYLKEARKISKGLRVKHLINDLETEKKEIDRVRLETKATQEIVAEQHQELEVQLDKAIRRERQADNRFFGLQDKEDELDRREKELQDKEDELSRKDKEQKKMQSSLDFQKEILDDDRTELRKSKALHQKELAELREYQKEKPAFEKAVADWNAKERERNQTEEKYQLMIDFINEHPEIIKEIEQTRAELEELEEKAKPLTDNEKLDLYQFVNGLSKETFNNINRDLKDLPKGWETFVNTYNVGKEIYEELQKQQERERLRELQRHQPGMSMTR